MSIAIQGVLGSPAPAQNFFRTPPPIPLSLPVTRNMAIIGTTIDAKYPQSEIQKLRIPLFAI